MKIYFLGVLIVFVALVGFYIWKTINGTLPEWCTTIEMIKNLVVGPWLSWFVIIIIGGFLIDSVNHLEKRNKNKGEKVEFIYGYKILQNGQVTSIGDGSFLIDGSQTYEKSEFLEAIKESLVENKEDVSPEDIFLTFLVKNDYCNGK